MAEEWYFAKRHIKTDELLDMKQIASLTNLTYWYIRALKGGHEKTNPPFPEPHTYYGRSPLWRREDIADWAYTRSLRKMNSGNEQIRDAAVSES
jgi:hypothetical protein